MKQACMSTFELLFHKSFNCGKKLYNTTCCSAGFDLTPFSFSCYYKQ